MQARMLRYRVEPVERRADQHRVMDQGADFDALLGGEAGGEPQHLGAVGLARESFAAIED